MMLGGITEMTETNRIESKAKLTDDFEKEVVAFLNYREGGVLYYKRGSEFKKVNNVYKKPI